jgi:glutaredoxin 3
MDQSSQKQFYDRKGAPVRLELYMFPSCPFCQKVMVAAQRLGYDLVMHDIHKDDSARATLKQVGGRTTVPCLFVNGKPMYESDDIVQYLRDEVKTQPS